MLLFLLLSCSEEYFYKSLLSGKFYRFLQTGRRDVDLSCVLHNIHCLPDEEIINCSIYIYLKYLYFQSNVIDVFFGVRSAGDCQLSCFYHHRSALSLTTNQEGRSHQTVIVVSASVQSSPGSTVLTQPSPSLVSSTPGQIIRCLSLSHLPPQYIDPPLSPGVTKLWRWITLSQVSSSHTAELYIADHFYQAPPPVSVARKWRVRVPTIITLVSRFVISDRT